jgi:para-nitrobenzyl esterase
MPELRLSVPVLAAIVLWAVLSVGGCSGRHFAPPDEGLPRADPALGAGDSALSGPPDATARAEVPASRDASDLEDAVPNAPYDVGGALDPLTVRVDKGVLRGVLDGQTRTFLGIPFAAPPIGPLRFAPPQPEPPWERVHDASRYGPACIQPVQDLPGPFSEDCLTLNVFAPLAAERAPVMVFLHGGGVMGGGMGYPARWLSAPSGVIVVTLNYRLGPLGFLQHPALDAELGAPSGNLGFLDQQRALTWVSHNIAAFGGDPENVTLFGQSFGAMSTCMHMFARGSQPLVQRFILESGTCARGHMTLLPESASRAASQGFVDAACSGAADVLACLRALPSERFVPSIVFELVAWRPYVDGVLFQASAQELLERGAVTRAPVIVGSTRREAAMFELGGMPHANSTLDFIALVTLFDPAHAGALATHYAPASDSEAGEAFIRLKTDVMFRCPAEQLARDLAAVGRRAYLFRFDVRPAVHAQELDYVFGWPSGGVSERFPREAPIPPWQTTIAAMQGYWTRFARTGDPNADSAPTWSPLGASTPTRLAIDQETTTADLPLEDPDCAFLLAEGVL